jgi:hypothetical protein
MLTDTSTPAEALRSRTEVLICKAGSKETMFSVAYPNTNFLRVTNVFVVDFKDWDLMFRPVRVARRRISVSGGAAHRPTSGSPARLKMPSSLSRNLRDISSAHRIYVLSMGPDSGFNGTVAGEP